MKKTLEKYQIYLESIKIKAPALSWILIMIILSLVLGLSFFLAGVFFEIAFLQKAGILAFFIILDLGIGLPIYFYTKHISEIERHWPDSLRLVADTMKSGASFEYALREASTADFGALSYEYNEIIRRLEMGDNMSTALTHMATRINSKIIRRTVTLIQECLRTGAQLSEILEEIANDTKNLYRIKKERVTKTMLQTIFIFAAGAVVAPFIFGLTNVITTFLTDVATKSGIVSGTVLDKAISTQATTSLLLDLYVVIEAAAAAVIVSLMREGKFSNAIIMFPVMVIVAYIVYSISQFILSTMLVGVI